MSDITNTIIEETVSEFLNDLDVPTYMRNEVKRVYEKNDLEQAIELVKKYNHILEEEDLNDLLDMFYPEKIAW